MDVWFDLLRVSRSAYVLESGPIGLGANGEIAIIYMEEFQIRAMETSRWKCQKDQSDEILKHLNSIKPCRCPCIRKRRSRGRCFTGVGSKAKSRRKDEAGRMHGSLQENTHQQQRQRIETSNQPPCVKKGICRLGTSTV